MIDQRTDMNQRPAVAGVVARVVATPQAPALRARCALWAFDAPGTGITAIAGVPTQHRRPSIE